MAIGSVSFGLRAREFRRRLEGIQDRLYRAAYAWCHDRFLADDLTQEATSRALERSSQLRDLEAFDAWVFRILANCYQDHFRRQRETTQPNDTALVEERTPEHVHHQGQIVSMVREGIAGLPVSQRCVLTLVDLEGFTYQEVAQVLDIPIGTVMSRLSRARLALKQRIGSYPLDSRSDARRMIRRVK